MKPSSAMGKRLRRVAVWVGYPLFYLFCLALFGYLTFPFNQLRGRVIAEFDRAQKPRPGEDPVQLSIDELDSYWFSGVEMTGVRLTIPPKRERPTARAGGFGGFGGPAKKEDDEPKAPSEIVIDHAVARVQLLPLLVGDVIVNFEAEALGGTVEGTFPARGEGEVDVQFDGLQLEKVGPLEDVLQGVPMSGFASGSVELTPKEGSLAMADGSLSLTIEGVKLGKKMKNEDTGEMEDVVEIQGIRVPAIMVGTIAVQGAATDGLLTVDRFGARGRDFELTGSGKVKLDEPLGRSQADLSLQFKFTDAYRTASAAATSLLGKPGDAIPPLIEAGRSPLKRAKTDDGFYRFTLNGPLAKLDPRPAGGASASRPATLPKPRRPPTRVPGKKALKPRPRKSPGAGSISKDRASVLAKRRPRTRRLVDVQEEEQQRDAPEPDRNEPPPEDEPEPPVEEEVPLEDDGAEPGEPDDGPDQGEELPPEDPAEP